MKVVVDIYTDGSWSGPRTRVGGWAAVFNFRDPPAECEISGAMQSTAAPRMELIAAIHALDWLSQPSIVTLYTDCPLVHFGMTGWLRVWKSRGWRTSRWKPLSHADLWERLDVAAARHTITCIRVRAHAGVPGNIRADRLARKARLTACEENAPARHAASQVPDTSP